MRPETSNHVIFGMTELGRVIRKEMGDERKKQGRRIREEREDESESMLEQG